MASIPDHSSLDPILLDRYLAGECTLGEQRVVLRWIRANPEEGRALERLLVAAKYRPLVEVDSFASVWQTFQRRVGITSTYRSDIGDGPSVRASAVRPSHVRSSGVVPRYFSHVGIALGATVALCAGLLFVWPTQPHSATARTYATDAGQQMTITLADGNRVTLAPRTMVTMRGNELTLSGEAVFEVQHRSERPYAVRTGNITTRVLGTKFDVRHYGDEPSVRVIVAEGKVSTGAREYTRVTAGQIATVTDSLTTVVTRPDEAARAMAWEHGTLIFRDTPLSDALAALGHWYGYTFQLGDTALARVRVNASFEHRSITDVIIALESVLHVKMTFDSMPGDAPPRVTLHPQRAVPSTRRNGTNPLVNYQSEVGR